MASCHEMKLGQVYVCEECGLELEVVKECKEAGLPDEECSCAAHGGFECCGEPLKLKEEA
jgi:predicted nucleic acid-binding Zn ribbon protein